MKSTLRADFTSMHKISIASIIERVIAVEFNTYIIIQL
jgi:hypothetical protein